MSARLIGSSVDQQRAAAVAAAVDDARREVAEAETARTSTGDIDVVEVEPDEGRGRFHTTSVDLQQPPQTPHHGDDRKSDPELESTPTPPTSLSRISRKNKRKMTEPRRRPNTDFSIRSLCSSSSNISRDADDVDDDDDEAEGGRRGRSTDAKIWKPTDVAAGSGFGTTPTVSDLQIFLAAAAAAVADVDSGGRSTPSAATATSSVGFYPLNIPTIYHRGGGLGLGGGAVPLFGCGAPPLQLLPPTTPTPLHHVRSSSAAVAATESSCSLDSIGAEHDRRTTEDDDDGGRPPGPVVAGQTVRFDTGGGDSPTPRRRPRPSPQSAASAASRRGDVTATTSVDAARSASPRKNYKNMTKQRRIDANARERTRVHTISAAFESLRRAVPSYSYNQRLSKLAILRIACSYILALARLADLDYGDDSTATAAAAEDEMDDEAEEEEEEARSSSTSSTRRRRRRRRPLSFAECVDLCTQTIQAEGKAKRRH
jgi:atonal protein 8